MLFVNIRNRTLAIIMAFNEYVSFYPDIFLVQFVKALCYYVCVFIWIAFNTKKKKMPYDILPCLSESSTFIAYRSLIVYTYLCWFIFFSFTWLFYVGLSHFHCACALKAILQLVNVDTLLKWLHYHNTMCFRAQNPYFNLHERAHTHIHTIQMVSFEPN